MSAIEETYKEIHQLQKNFKRVVAFLLGDLTPSFIKIGKLCSIRLDDLTQQRDTKLFIAAQIS